MTIDEAIEAIEKRMKRLHPCDIEPFEMAISALRAQQEKNKPLTLEQIKEMDGMPIWWTDWKHSEWCIIRVINGRFFAQSGGSNNCHVNENTYGEKWLAYRQPPKETLYDT